MTIVGCLCAATDAGGTEVLAESVTAAAYSRRHSLPAQRHLPLSSAHLAGRRSTRPSSFPTKSSLQLEELFKQELLLLLQRVKQFSDLGVLRLHGLDFALQVLWLAFLGCNSLLHFLVLCSATATVLFGPAAGDRPEGRSRDAQLTSTPMRQP